jgi:quinol monooxygenase YgiN
MLKSVVLPAVALTAAALLLLRGEEAAAQTATAFVNVVDLEITFIGLTMMMIRSYSIRPFASVAPNKCAAPQPQADPPLALNVDEIDVADGQTDKFIAAVKSHAAASVQDPGCREFHVAQSQTKDNHVLLFSAFDDAAALAAHQASDHYKAYQAVTKGIVLKSSTMPLSPVAMLTRQ